MTPADLEHGLGLVEQRLGELREVDTGLTITLDMRPDLPLCLVQLCGIEMLVDPTNLLKRTDDRQQPGHDPASAGWG